MAVVRSPTASAAAAPVQDDGRRRVRSRDRRDYSSSYTGGESYLLLKWSLEEELIDQ